MHCSCYEPCWSSLLGLSLAVGLSRPGCLNRNACSPPPTWRELGWRCEDLHPVYCNSIHLATRATLYTELSGLGAIQCWGFALQLRQVLADKLSCLCKTKLYLPLLWFLKNHWPQAIWCPLGDPLCGDCVCWSQMARRPRLVAPRDKFGYI